MRLAALAIAAILISAPAALAQDITPPMPDTNYGPGDLAAAPAGAGVPMPNPDPGGDGTVVTVPIPGGGSVQVEGPGVEPETAPISPVDTWGVHAQTPNTVDPSPLGP
ncbi:MAG: hypothetical protein ACLQDV_03135 [Candidatus Binataceae bacterium]